MALFPQQTGSCETVWGLDPFCYLFFFKQSNFVSLQQCTSMVSVTSKWSVSQVDLPDSTVLKSNLFVGIPDSKSVWVEL